MKEYKYHYTYLIQNLNPDDEKQFYIGVKSCDCLPEENTDYMGSSAILTEDIQQLGSDKFQKLILAEFDSREEAENHENELHVAHNAAQNPIFYNKKNGTVGFHTTLESTAKRCNTISDPHWKATTGKAMNRKIAETRNNPHWKATIGAATNKSRIANTYDNPIWVKTVGAEAISNYKTTVSDPQWQDTVGKEKIRKQKETKATTDWKIRTGEKLKRTFTDPMWLATSGREKSKKLSNLYADPTWANTTGKQKSKKISNTKSSLEWTAKNTFTCMHCNREIKGKSNFNRWHGNNCKMKGKNDGE